MKTFLECVPCIMNAAIQAPTRFTDDWATRQKIVKKLAAEISCFDMTRTPPELGGIFNKIMAAALNVNDPYLGDKRKFNQLAKNYLPNLRQQIEQSNWKLGQAVKIAGAANFIDFGAPAGKTDGDLDSLFKTALNRKLSKESIATIKNLEQKTKESSTALFIADNAGEIVVDRLLIEHLLELQPNLKITVAVRSGPAINDALIDDAVYAGLDKICTVIESGADLPGTPISQTSDEFKAIFNGSDIIISKGQGNFETLSHENAAIFFILTAKCQVVANHTDCKVGDFVITNK